MFYINSIVPKLQSNSDKMYMEFKMLCTILSQVSATGGCGNMYFLDNCQNNCVINEVSMQILIEPNAKIQF